MSFVYVLKSKAHEWYYVGSTENIEKRLRQHNLGQVKSTHFRRPYDVVYIEEFPDIYLARIREKQIKRSRSIKDNIIESIHGPIV